MLKLKKGEKGFTLIEVLVALGVLGLIAAALLMAIATASKAILIADERTIAESLARSQLECVKEQPYIYDDDENDAIYYEIDFDDEHPSFSIGSIISIDGEDEAVEEVMGVPWDSAGNIAVPTDVGLQKITLIVCNNGEEGVSLEDYVIILEGYKVDEGVY